MTRDLFNVGRIDEKSWREKINHTVRESRKNQTKEEGILWEILRNRNLSGKKFLRQHPIIYETYSRPYFFVADFYCAEKNLVIEIDGRIHDLHEKYDEQRTLILQQKELKVLRIKNEEFLRIDKVIEKIKAMIE